MPINYILDIIFGRVTFTVPRSDLEKCMNLLHRNCIYSKKLREEKDSEFCFTVRKSDSDKTVRLLDKSGIKVYSIKGKGLPFLLKRYKKRIGIPIGLLMIALSLWISGKFVWQIEYTGNDSVPDHVVEEMLFDAGFGVGTYIPKVDLYKLCSRFIRENEDFSYISVNMEGTTARVQLRERRSRQEKTEYKASNLVAKYSGQIESLTVYSGQTVVGREDVVREGEILVSGFSENKSGFDIVRSTGSVYAYVTRRLTVEIPFEKTVKVYSGKKQTKYELMFFGKSITLKNENDGSLDSFDEFCDRERVVLFDRVRLPLMLNKTLYSGYDLKKQILTPDEARASAEAEMSRIMVKELADSEILEVKPHSEQTEDSYRLVYEIYCLTDIAEEKEIIIDEKK